MGHSRRFRLRNHIDELETLRENLEAFGETVGITRRCLFRLNLALDELFTNVVTCGYEDRNIHYVDVALRANEKELNITIVDDGTPFNPLPAEPPDTQCGVEKRKVGGLGIHLVKQLMDHLNYRRENGQNIVTLTKKREIPSESID
ncbi:MAG: ATP-binding protein [Desulfococcaceae bacterium]